MASNATPSEPTLPQESLTGRENFDPLELEKQYVHEVYDAIAPEFSSTRHSAWPGVMRFLNNQPPESVGADIGCGNGKYLLALAQSQPDSKPVGDSNAKFVPIVALERSVKLAEIVRQRGFDIAIGDLIRLPFRPGWFDFVICIAVIHHLSTRTRRVQALHELATLLRPGGQGLIQVWAKEQRDPNCSEPATYIRRKVKNKSTDQSIDSQICQTVQGITLPVHVSGTEFPASDMLVPWKTKRSSQSQTEENLGPNQSNRYYHLFVQGELDQLILDEVPCFKIDKSYYEQGNWVVQVTKLAN